MALPEHTLPRDDEFVAVDLPVDDPATTPPDEGDIGQAPDPEVFERAAQPDIRLASITPAQSAQERNVAVQAAVVALRNRNTVHYTQGSRRWDGINRGLLGARGQYPAYADCSSFVTWCLWNGMGLHHRPDTVNGNGWRAGYTGTLIMHGSRVSSERSVLPGDLVFYGSRGRASHVAICIGRGLVISHGSEAGPFQLPLHYRRDFLQIRRYIGGDGPAPIRTVTQQQQAVNGLGYRPPLVVDNKFGPKTRAGVKWLQRKVGTTPDGQWGPKTEAKYQAYIRTHRP
jgi:cell wall-associated NlpC family hydrolase